MRLRGAVDNWAAACLATCGASSERTTHSNQPLAGKRECGRVGARGVPERLQRFRSNVHPTSQAMDSMFGSFQIFVSPFFSNTNHMQLFSPSSISEGTFLKSFIPFHENIIISFSLFHSARWSSWLVRVVGSMSKLGPS
jgi:hypothetical protein